MANELSTKSGALTTLRVTAALLAVLAVVQAIFGFFLTGTETFVWHQRVAETALLVSFIATIAAFLWSRRSAQRGLMMHAAGTLVLGLLQFGLGEMMSGGLVMVHIVLGVAYLLAAVSLATLAFRKPGTARRVGGTLA